MISIYYILTNTDKYLYKTLIIPKMSFTYICRCIIKLYLFNLAKDLIIFGGVYYIAHAAAWKKTGFIFSTH